MGENIIFKNSEDNQEQNDSSKSFDSDPSFDEKFETHNK